MRVRCAATSAGCEAGRSPRASASMRRAMAAWLEPLSSASDAIAATIICSTNRPRSVANSADREGAQIWRRGAAEVGFRGRRGGLPRGRKGARGRRQRGASRRHWMKWPCLPSWLLAVASAPSPSPSRRICVWGEWGIGSAAHGGGRDGSATRI
uniref:Uncharacterized protein n=1 Tax=Arundo donax TaxID=35708 RepID=A0A0A9CUH0_ARUDO